MNSLECLTSSVEELRKKADIHRTERDRLQTEAETCSEERRVLSSKASRLESEAKHKEKLAADDAISAREETLLRDQWQAKLDLLMSRGGLGDIEGARYQIRHHTQAKERLERSVRSAERDIASKRKEAEALRKKANEAGSMSMSLKKKAQSEHDAYISVMRRIQRIIDSSEDQS